MKKGVALLLGGSSSASTGTTAPAETAKETVKETVEETQTGAVNTATATTEQPEDDGKTCSPGARREDPARRMRWQTSRSF